MVSIWPRRVRDKIWPEPLPPQGSFDGQTILVTGATGGLGLAAAVHFASFGATVILTSRTLSKGEEAKKHVIQHAGIITQGRVHVLELDMNRYSSCVSFVESLKHSEVGHGGLDVAVLNAGLINIDYAQSSEGWEQTVQVHTLSTTLLGLLLLDWMKQQRKVELRAPHLIFVTSRKHILPDIANWPNISAEEGILRHFSDEKNWPTGQIDPNYSETKLLLTYAVEEIRKKAIGKDGSVDVIVNTVCPGLVTTDLGRRITNLSFTMQLFIPLYFTVLGKTPEYGARTYLMAARTSVAEHGKYVQSIYTEDEYRSLAIPNVTSDAAKRVQELVWKEISTELKLKVPALQNLKISV
ncbi:hypothetical protein BKA66DRAFT_573235 [Pyrenochaeta sp. MPI-SDFR-AT-0127]|nr:hypothetical protein BKA66DRAFT_573235 [Pyrenochaeta sp. MPI-SDFR-AT-0127]